MLTPQSDFRSFRVHRYVTVATASLVSIRLFVFCLTERATSLGVQTGATMLTPQSDSLSFRVHRYVTVATASLVSIRLFVFCLTEHATAITGVQTGHRATGLGNIYGNKGAVGCSFHYHNTSFCFVNAHLVIPNRQCASTMIRYTETKKQSPNTGARANTTLHK